VTTLPPGIPPDRPFDRRIAIVSHTHPDLTKGGAEGAAYALYRGLREIGHDAIFVASCLETDLPRIEPRPHEFLLPRDDALYDHFYQIAPGDMARRLRDLLVAHDVGVVNFHHFLFLGLNAIRALRGRDMRVVLTLHEYLAICHHHGQMVTRPAKNLCRAAGRIPCQDCFPEIHGEEFDIRRAHFLEVFETVDAFVSPSLFLRDRFVQWGLPAGRIHVVENGLFERDDKLSRAGPRAAAPGGARALTVGYFGQITPFKGVGVILDAVERIERLRAADPEAPVPPVRFRVHGNLVGLDPAFVARFEALARDSPLLHFAGPYANADVVSLMRACDYVVVPSQWWENSPVVIQEAYAAGCPVIASDLGGLAEKVVDGVTGLRFSTGDPDSLLSTLDRAAEPGILERLRAGLPQVPTAAEMARGYARVMSGEAAAE
jgi:glycosyltransferase involved in cell wall biosynthesis